MFGLRVIFIALISVISFHLSGRAMSAELPDCSSKTDLGLRQQCEEAFSRYVTTSSRTTMLPGGWRLVKTPDARGGAQVVSIMHVSDTAKSDIGLAGLTLRCGRIGIEILLVLLDPLPHGLNPMVIVKDYQNERQFETTAVDGGQMLLLSQNASTTQSWYTASEVSLEISIKPTPIRGVISVAGLAESVRVLSQSCTAR